ncbi:DUF3780 domain-containing protein [Synechocystis sp. PCC 7339]|uniref:anti-phage-associated DUF3780 domain-containing protein n=1 Tax=Synechocystis sp. PCC 7339 TaxID=2782213 RepID=UPI001CBAF18E|nr:anti-phage-associated DUF3780 domain-containing protein [Synechocystis sp. PCC 7339]UAJ74036.1 DUF3780 domain-containing protein [Synechocystis sp. PCC 7339]
MPRSSKSHSTSQAPSHPTLGFGVPTTLDPHHFVVKIPRGNYQPVHIIENLGMSSEEDTMKPLERAILDRPLWTEISGPVKRHFNQRLKSHNLKAGQWKVGDNLIDRLLGKELCVLAWAVEGLASEKVGNAVGNWLALRPEERWWLFGMTATTVGLAKDQGKGWRMALRYALGDTPQSGRLPIRRAKKPVETNIFETLPLFQS